MHNNRSHSSDGKLLFGLLFGCLCDGVLSLSRGYLPSDRRIIQLHAMCRRVVLRRRGPDNSIGRLCIGLLLRRVFNSLLELSGGNLFIIGVIDELLKLSSGLLSGLDGIDSLHGMPRRIVLRNSGSHSSDGKLLFRIIFG